MSYARLAHGHLLVIVGARGDRVPKRSEFAAIHSTMQMVRFRFDDGRESAFAGPPLPRDYGRIEAIEFGNYPASVDVG